MKHVSSRRNACKILLGGAAFAALPDPARAEVSGAKLAEGFTLITGAGSAVLLFTSSEGNLLVDGGSPDQSAALLKLVAEQTGGKPVRVLFNTHWHLESTGSNEALGQAGAKILAHENTRLWMTTEFEQQWANKEYTPRPKTAWPNETFYTTGKRTFGGQPVEYGYMLQAHTDGDIYVHFPETKILMAGDAVQPGRFPLLDWSTGGWISGMVEAHKTLLAVAKDDTKIVPASGPVLTKAELQKLAEKTAALRDLYLKNFRMGKSPQDMLAEGMVKEFEPEWGDPKLFLQTCYRGMWGHVREIGGIV